jgi:porphobilinogen synthase (EC 4.2.1.24)
LVDDLIYPIFIEDGKDIKKEIPSMPGIFRWSLDRVNEELDEVANLGIPAVLLFDLFP